MSEKAKKKLTFPKFGPQDFLVLAFAVIVFIVNIGIVKECYNPFVFNDEMGYWTHAATMAGYDWTGISDHLAWYSFGYSFMLAPIMKLFSDPTGMYRAALVLNIIMQIISYYMYIYILRYMFPKLNKVYAGAASAAAILYTSYQLNAGIAFSETALLFVTTLIAFTLVRIIKNPTYLNLGCLGVLCAYLFMIHNRCIGIVMSAALAVGLAVIFRKVKLRYAGVFLAVLAVGFILNSLIRNHLEEILWSTGGASGNNADSVLGNLKIALSSGAGIKRLLSVMASQAFAAFAGTMCLALFALWVLFRDIIAAALKAVRAVKKKKRLSRVLDDRIYIALFIFCAFISTWIISSIFMYDFSRIDHVLYTRYFDITLGLLIMIGICRLCTVDAKDIAFIFVMPFIMRLGALRASVLMRSVGEPVFNKVCAPGICKLYAENGQNFHAYITVSVTAFFIIALILVFPKKYNIRILAASVLCSHLFISNAPEALEAIRVNQKAYAGDRELVSRVREIEDAEIYVMNDTGTFKSFLQYELADRKIEVFRDMSSLSENAYIFADKSNVLKYSEYELVDRSDRHIVLSAKKSEDNTGKLPLAFMNTFDHSYYIEDEDVIQSNPDNHYLCYGPYLSLDEGEYIFSLDMTVDEMSVENIGFAEIRSNTLGTVYAHEEITADMPDKNGNVTLELNADAGTAVPDLEIIVFLYDPAAMSMQLNSIKVNTEE